MPIINYPLDLTAAALTNHVVGEVRTITSGIERFIVPVGGPFYTVTMIVRNNITNAVLLPNTQYKILHHIPEATQDSGKNVCAVVYITDSTIPSVRLEYQVVGGQYQNMAPLIAQLITDHPLDPDSPNQIGWGQIFGMPNQYPPTAHIHPANQFLGYSDLVLALENLRVAVANGDNLAISAIYRYIEIMFSSSQYVTIDQLNSLLITPEPFVKMHPTYAGLKQRNDMVANLAVVYGTIGRNLSTDGLGMLFRWDHTSTTTPDEKHVLRPNHILGNDPGRFVSLLWCQNVLDRHGIDIAIAAKSTLSTNFDIDNAKTPGKYWVENTQLNRAFDYGILEVSLVGGTLDQPAEVHQRMYWDRREATRNCNHLGVWTTWSFTKSRFLSIERNLNTGNVDLNSVVDPDMYYYGSNCPNRPTDEGILSVHSEAPGVVYQIAHGRNNQKYFRGMSDGITWSEWYKLMDTVEMRRHGISSAVAAYHTVGATDYLNTIKTPGKYWFANTQPDRPFDYGILEVTLVGGTLTSPGEVHQEAYFAGRRSTRSCSYLGVWGAWSDVVITDLAVDRSLANSDLDDAILPGHFYYSITSDNRPSSYGLLEVRRETNQIVYQKAHSSENNFYTRYRYLNGTWSPWKRYVSESELNEVKRDIGVLSGTNLGIVPAHFGSTSYILPAFIGDNVNNQTVSIFISGRLAQININDIGHIDGSNIPSEYCYIYLFETAPNVFTLSPSTVAPKLMDVGNMTTIRPYLPIGNYVGDYLTSPSVFVGIAVADVFEAGQPSRWAYVRNWFQDPGAVELVQFGTGDASNLSAMIKKTGPIVRMDFDDDVHLTPPVLRSDYFNKNLSQMKFVAWKNEVIDLDFFINYSLQHASAGFYGAMLEVILSCRTMQGNSIIPQNGRFQLPVITPAGVANAWVNGYRLMSGLSQKIIAPETGEYTVEINGEQTSGAVLWLAGHHSQGINRTVLTAKLNQVHSFHNLVINKKGVIGQTLTVTIPYGDYYNLDMHAEFVSRHGPISNYPLLSEIVFVTSGGVIGSSSVNGASIFFSTNFPNIPLRLRNFSVIVGKGGIGGNNSGSRNGGAGGHAIVSHRLLLVENFGIIGGGGGGGGGGGSGSSGATGSDGGTGGGGAGRDVGQPGTRHRGPTGDGNDREGEVGSAGTLYVGGDGGISYYAGPRNSNFSQGGYGGKGGDLGQNGTNGENGRIANVANGGFGGAAGKAIRSFMDVYVIVQGDIRGQIERYV